MQRWISTIHSLALSSRSWPVALRYAITAGLVVLTTWGQMRWGTEAADKYPFLVYIPVIFVSGALLDSGNGFFATALSAILCSYYFLYPHNALGVMTSADQAALVLFIVIGFVVSSIVEALHVGLVAVAIEREVAQAAFKDRDLLLNELAHRTRNDFANVVTLLNLQSRTASAEAKESLVSAAERVQTIARVHRRLELRDDHVVVDTKAYISELCADLRLSRLAMRPVAIDCMVESHSLGLEKAVPLGLIINESVTNAAKHAFPDQRRGTISVTFQRTGEAYKLVVADDGVGRSATSGQSGIGNRLMLMLASQLGSTLDVEERSPGVAVIVTIPAKKARQ